VHTGQHLQPMMFASEAIAGIVTKQSTGRRDSHLALADLGRLLHVQPLAVVLRQHNRPI